MYHITLIVKDICDKPEIANGSLAVACDGLEALKKAMSTGTQHYCLYLQHNIRHRTQYPGHPDTMVLVPS